MIARLRRKLMTLLIATIVASAVSLALPSSTFARRGAHGDTLPRDPSGTPPPGKCRVISGGADIPGKQCGW